MKTPTLPPDEHFPIPVEGFPDISHPVSGESVADAPKLMPYEAVAKAIFVKANGLTAYNRATRFVRRTD